MKKESAKERGEIAASGSEELLEHVARALSKSPNGEVPEGQSFDHQRRRAAAATYIPLACCLSPNGACVAMVDATGSLRIYHLGSLHLSLPPGEEAQGSPTAVRLG